MPDFSDTSRPTVSRRTIARTAAWSAPVIVASVAAPAVAASQLSGALSLGAITPFVSDEARNITGSIQTTVGVQPADLALVATVTTVSGGTFTITTQPVVSGSTFTLALTAPNVAAGATLTVRSSNYPAYVAATVSIEAAAPGTVTTGDGTWWALVPLANNWSYAGDENGIRFYTAGSLLKVAGATKLLDLRLQFGRGMKSEPIPSNRGFAPFASAVKVSDGYPTGATGPLPVTVYTTFDSIKGPTGDQTSNKAVQAAVHKVTLGASSYAGVGALMANTRLDSDPAWIPNYDPTGKVTAATGFYVSAPGARPASGTQLWARTIVTLTLPGNRVLKAGFLWNCSWSY